jgi:radical SAM superfamily enzyme YgiQ (UPF0313 family)
MNEKKPVIHVTGNRRPITDLDSLPLPDRSLVHYDTYNRYIGQAMVKSCISMQATRGCPYNCKYCYRIWPKKHVFRSAQHIFEEVKLYYRLGIRKFAFVDDIFNLNTRNSKRFFQSIIDSKMDVQLYFPAGLRGDLLTADYIDLMVEAGTVNLALALETASPRLQELIGKNLDIEKLRENIVYFCEQYPQVILELFTMHGFPTETEEEAMMTLDFIREIKWLHFPYVNVLRIYPNTEMEALAVLHGISPQAIVKSENLPYHELPDTLPFDKSFTFEYQTRFLHEYFFSRERLLHVLPYQMKLLTADEIVQKYTSYLPEQLNGLTDLLEFAGIAVEELGIDGCRDFEYGAVNNLEEKLKTIFPRHEPDKGALRILLLDLSQFFSREGHMVYDVVDVPLGLINLVTYLEQQLGPGVHGKIAKSRIDFDSYSELKELLAEFKPAVIGIRTLTFYKKFFHEVVSLIREWGVDVPVIAGGPYATCEYEAVLQDPEIDLVVLGEGEITFHELIKEMIKNGGRRPAETVLKKINGIAFVPGGKPGGPGDKMGQAEEINIISHFIEDMEDE